MTADQEKAALRAAAFGLAAKLGYPKAIEELKRVLSELETVQWAKR